MSSDNFDEIFGKFGGAFNDLMGKKTPPVDPPGYAHDTYHIGDSLIRIPYKISERKGK